MAIKKTFVFTDNELGEQEEVRIFTNETVTYGVKAKASILDKDGNITEQGDEWRIHYKLNDTWFATAVQTGEYSDFGKAQICGIMFEIVKNVSNNLKFVIISGIKV